MSANSGGSDYFLRGAGALRRRLEAAMLAAMLAASMTLAAGVIGAAVRWQMLPAEARASVWLSLKAEVAAMHPSASYAVDVPPALAPSLCRGSDACTIRASMVRSLFARGAGAALVHDTGVSVGTWAALSGCAGLALWFVFLGPSVRRRGAALDNARDHLRGTELMAARELGKRASARIAREGGGDALALGGVPVPPSTETLGWLMVGATGSGKTTAMRQMLEGALARGDAAVVFDPSLDLQAAHYSEIRGDAILNPFDARSPVWDPLCEIHDSQDAAGIAAMLAGRSNDESKEWVAYARMALAALMVRVREAGGDAVDLARLVTRAEQAELAASLAGTSAGRLLAGDSKAAASVVFMLAGAAEVIGRLPWAADRERFSWREWAARLDTRGTSPVVWLGATARHAAAARGILGAHVAAATAALLSLPPRAGRRVWFFLDEFPALPMLEDLPQLPAMARKYGGAVVLGVQDPGQIAAVYGRDGAGAFLGCAGNRFVFRMPGGTGADWAAAALGDAEARELAASDHIDADDGGARGVVARQRQVKTVVIAGELGGLAVGEGFLSLAGMGAVARVQLDRPSDAAAAAAYVRRDAGANIAAALLAREGVSAGGLIAPSDSVAVDYDTGEIGL